jgi:hypothetical protein
MRFIVLFSLIFLTSFSFSQSVEKTSKKEMSVKQFTKVKKIETDKSKVKMLSPVNSKKVILDKNKLTIIEPKKK